MWACAVVWLGAVRHASQWRSLVHARYATRPAQTGRRGWAPRLGTSVRQGFRLRHARARAGQGDTLRGRAHARGEQCPQATRPGGHLLATVDPRAPWLHAWFELRLIVIASGPRCERTTRSRLSHCMHTAGPGQMDITDAATYKDVLLGSAGASGATSGSTSSTVDRRAAWTSQLYGRMVRGTSPASFERLSDESYAYKRLSWVTGPEGMTAILRAPTHYHALEQVGFSKSWIEKRVRDGVTQFKLVVLPSKALTSTVTPPSEAAGSAGNGGDDGPLCRLADWDGIFELVDRWYTEVAPLLRAHEDALRTTPFDEIDASRPESRPAGRMRQIAEIPVAEKLSHPEFLTPEKLLAVAAGSEGGDGGVPLWHARAFLYHSLGLNYLFAGDGYSVDTATGQRTHKEYLAPNLPLKELPGALLVDLNVHVPELDDEPGVAAVAGGVDSGAAAAAVTVPPADALALASASHPARQQIFVVRGPAGAGKSTVCTALCRALRAHGRETALIEQDYVRNTVIGPSSRGREASAAMILSLVRDALRLGFDVVLEGILNMKVYGAMLETIAAEAAGPGVASAASSGSGAAAPPVADMHVFFFEVSLDETIRRHGTRAKAAEFGADEMRKWWPNHNRSGLPGEVVVPQSSSADETLCTIASHAAMRFGDADWLHTSA